MECKKCYSHDVTEDEELEKETLEIPNIPIQCVDGSCPMALSDEYEERGMDVVHSCAECPYQPKKEPQECVWTKDIYKRMHTSCHHLTEEDIETTFCKYCGRKVKVN